MFWKKKTHYIDWKQYSELTTAMEELGFVQQTRRETIRNVPGIGKANA